jgi:hypothetical protein
MITLRVAVGRQVFSPLAYYTFEVPELSATVEADTQEEANELANAVYADLRSRQQLLFGEALSLFIVHAVEVKHALNTEVPTGLRGKATASR